MNHTLAAIFLSLYLVSIVWVAYSLITAELIEDDEELIYTTDDIRNMEVFEEEVLN